MSEGTQSDSASPADLRSRAAKLVFGDRSGLTLFLGTLAFVWLYWRAGLFITDTRTIVETLSAVSQGRLWIEPATGQFLSSPGAVVTDGYVYGRNYGQVVLALPLLWAIDAISAIADLRVALLALWHATVLALLLQLGRLFDARRLAIRGGSVVVLALFVLNVALATRFIGVSHELLALQLGTMLAAALLAVLVYRLLRRHHQPGIAIVAGAASVIVLPVGFWAPIPKRHVLGAAILLALLYAFDRSRTPESMRVVAGVGPIPVWRAGMYALVGLLAWIHAAEALFVVIVLVVVDVPTAPSNDWRTLAAIGIAFLASLLPFFITNGLITGDILKPPRTLTPADSTARSADILRDSADAADRASAGSKGLGGGMIAALVWPIFEKTLWVWTLLVTQITGSISNLLRPDALVQTWLRSGSISAAGSVGLAEFRAVNLAVVESMPLLGGLAAIAVAPIRHRISALVSAIRATDALAVGLIAAYVLLFMGNLPIHVQVNVRYLLPTYPLFLYLLVRQGAIRELLTGNIAAVTWSYAAVGLLASQLLLAYVVAANLTVSAAAQLHAVLGLAAALWLGLSLVGSAIEPRIRPVAGVALGVAAGLGTVFVLLTGLAYFSFIGQYVLPASQVIADTIGSI